MIYTLYRLGEGNAPDVALTQSEDFESLQQRCDEERARGGCCWVGEEGGVVHPHPGPLPEALWRTPWGEAIEHALVRPGVWFVGTNQHAGFHVSPDVNARIPAEVRRENGWYEADVEGALVASFVPLDCAPRAEVLAVIERYYAPLYAAVVRGEG